MNKKIFDNVSCKELELYWSTSRKEVEKILEKEQQVNF